MPYSSKGSENRTHTHTCMLKWFCVGTSADVFKSISDAENYYGYVSVASSGCGELCCRKCPPANRRYVPYPAMDIHAYASIYLSILYTYEHFAEAG